MRDWLYVWSLSNLNMANKFRHALVAREMSSRNFLNVLLHNMQDGNMTCDLRVVQVVVTDITNRQ